MITYLQTVLTAQFEAALSMMKQRVEACPIEYFEGFIGDATVRQLVYHALFWLDYYLTSHEDAFILHTFVLHGGDERRPVISDGLSKEETMAYIEYCRNKIRMSIAAETEESLQGGSGFPSIFVKTKLTRGELHLYNLRHLQHHTAQLSVYLRRVSDENNLSLDLTWVGTGWPVNA